MDGHLAKIFFIAGYMLGTVLEFWQGFVGTLIFFPITTLLVHKLRFEPIFCCCGLIWYSWANHSKAEISPIFEDTQQFNIDEFRFDHLESKLAEVSQPTRGWLSSLLLGQQNNQDPRIRHATLNIGIYHLVVVSGLHISILATIFLSIIEFPIRAIYTIAPRTILVLPFVRKCSSTLVLLILWAYSWMVGLGAPVQRALLIHTLYQGQRIGLIQASRPHLIVSAALLQILLFPMSELTLGLVFSWTIYLILIFHHPVTAKSSLTNSFYLHLKIGVIVSLFLKQTSISWFILSPILSSLASTLLFSGILVMAFPGTRISAMCEWLHKAFLDMLLFLDKHSPQTIPLSETVWTVGICFALIMTALGIWKLFKVPYME